MLTSHAVSQFPRTVVLKPVVMSIFIKILAESDAIKAVNAGVDGILVSNHGARQLDGVPATVSTHYSNYSQMWTSFQIKNNIN